MFDNRVQYVFHTASGAAFGHDLEHRRRHRDVRRQPDHLALGRDDRVRDGQREPDGRPRQRRRQGEGLRRAARRSRSSSTSTGSSNAVATVRIRGLETSSTVQRRGLPAAHLGAIEPLVVGSSDRPRTADAPSNHFATFNALAIVVSIDKSLLTKGGPFVSVWAGTYSHGAARRRRGAVRRHHEKASSSLSVRLLVAGAARRAATTPSLPIRRRGGRSLDHVRSSHADGHRQR